MSSNNEILITELPSHFEIADIDVDNNDGLIIGKTKSLRGAIIVANKYIRENEVEYGIRFELFK